MNEIYDYLIIGAGVTGSSIAYGLSKNSNASIGIVDAYDNTYRASVGNYGLTWMQSKGYGQEFYAQLSEQVSYDWDEFKDEIEKNSGYDLEYVKSGGLTFCQNEKEFLALEKKITNLNSYYKNENSKTVMLKHDELKEIYPNLGDSIYGASYNKQDGYLNPLILLKAQLKLAQDLGVKSINNFCTKTLEKSENIYTIKAEDGRILKTKQLVLAAGLSNMPLAKQLNINVPLYPQKGHILVAQKMPKLDLIPCFNVRQTKDGTLLIGVSNEDIGFDISIDELKVSNILKKATSILPMLKDINLIRSWASLRIIPKDGKPIYDSINNSLHIITTHSAITLAPLHCNEVSKSILKGQMPDNLKDFSLKRFEQGEVS